MQEVFGRQLGRIGFRRAYPLAKQAAAAHRHAGAHSHVVGDTGRRPLGLVGERAGQRPDVICQRRELRPGLVDVRPGARRRTQ